MGQDIGTHISSFNLRLAYLLLFLLFGLASLFTGDELFDVGQYA